MSSILGTSDYPFIEGSFPHSNGRVGVNMAEKFNLQDRFLNHLRLHKVEVKVFLVNGFQIRGEIRSFDSFTILLEDGKTQSLIYKHAISTITPSSYVKLAKPQEDDASSDEESNKTVNVSK